MCNVSGLYQRTKLNFPLMGHEYSQKVKIKMHIIVWSICYADVYPRRLLVHTPPFMEPNRDGLLHGQLKNPRECQSTCVSCSDSDSCILKGVSVCPPYDDVLCLPPQWPRSGCTILERYQRLSYRWPFAFQSLGHGNSFIILAKDGSASARLAFKLHQRPCVLLLQSFFNPSLLSV